MDSIWKEIGHRIGSAVGRAVGAGIRRFIDRLGDSRNDGELTEEDVLTVFVACFLSSFVIETGHLKTEDRRFIAKLCNEVGDISRLSLDDNLALLDEWGTNDELFDRVIGEAQDDEDLRRALLTFGWRLASRDNHIDDNEGSWLCAVAEVMGASEEELHANMLRYYRLPDDDGALIEARSTLGVAEDATPQEIGRRYRELSRKYHPDSHAIADDTLKELAAEKFAKIAAAYDALQSRCDTKYWGTSIDGKELVVPKARQAVRCFFCEQKCRLPDEGNFAFSRCPECQSLLLFEEEIARAIFGEDE